MARYHVMTLGSNVTLSFNKSDLRVAWSYEALLLTRHSGYMNVLCVAHSKQLGGDIEITPASKLLSVPLIYTPAPCAKGYLSMHRVVVAHLGETAAGRPAYSASFTSLLTLIRYRIWPRTDSISFKTASWAVPFRSARSLMSSRLRVCSSL